jgi:hypothetical protein
MDQAEAGEAPSVDGVISTRRGNGQSWQPLCGVATPPVGKWELKLSNTEEVENRFQTEEIHVPHKVQQCVNRGVGRVARRYAVAWAR